MGNYRPISLLSIFYQIQEKLMCKRLVNFLEKFNILYDNQFGFRPKYSTIHAILLTIDKIQMAIEDGKFSCGIFLDFSKAFDTVNHFILLKKLSFYGIRGPAYNWFQSYLSQRKQFVSIGNTQSDYCNLTLYLWYPSRFCPWSLIISLIHEWFCKLF